METLPDLGTDCSRTLSQAEPLSTFAQLFLIEIVLEFAIGTQAVILIVVEILSAYKMGGILKLIIITHIVHNIF